MLRTRGESITYIPWASGKSIVIRRPVFCSPCSARFSYRSCSHCLVNPVSISTVWLEAINHLHALLGLSCVASLSHCFETSSNTFCEDLTLGCAVLGGFLCENVSTLGMLLFVFGAVSGGSGGGGVELVANRLIKGSEVSSS